MAKWFDAVTNAAEDAGERLGASIGKLLRKVGRAPSDAKADDVSARLKALTAKYEDDLAGLLDELPGVPNQIATLAAHGAKLIVDSAIAGSLEGYKANN